MPEYLFETHSPVNLVVEISKGNVHVRCTDTTESTVVVEGKHAEDVMRRAARRLDHRRRARRGRIFGDNAPPRRGDRARRQQPGRPHRQRRRPASRAGPATASCAAAPATAPSTPSRATCSSRPAPARSGSTRSAATSRIKSGSGDVELGQAAGTSSISTGSGDVTVETARGNDGRQDRLRRPQHRRHGRRHVVQHRQRGRLDRARTPRPASRVKGASGDVSIGVTAGVPVWTDITTVSGTIRSDLRAPASRRRARTTSRSGPRPSAATSP